MEKELEKTFSKASLIALTPEEKIKIREKILIFQKNYVPAQLINKTASNPVRTASEGRQINIRSPINIFGFLLNLKPWPIVLAIALLLSVGGGVSYAAEGALPGNIFYPVKVGVNESVRGWLALSAEEKTKWQTRLAERRLEEAEKLGFQGRLDAQTRANIESRFAVHAEKVKEKISEFEEKKEFHAAADLSSNFETSLKTHAKILEKLDTRQKSGKTYEIKEMIVKVRKEGERAERKRKDSEIKVLLSGKVEVKAAAEGKVKAAENKILEVKKFIEKMKTEFGRESVVSAEAKIKLAEEAFVAGKVKLAAESYGEAFAEFQQAIRIAQEAKLLIEAEKELKLEIKINGEANENSSHEEKEKKENNSSKSPGRGTPGKIEGNLKLNLEL